MLTTGFMNSDASEAVGQFFSDAWAVYEKVLDGDYLSHRALYQGLTDFLRSRPAPTRLLELGCGDARLSLELLRALPGSQYLGFDSSPVALQLAGQRLASHSGGWQLVQGDVRTCLDSVQESWDCVLASYCLHHLSRAEKQAVLRDIRRILPTGGTFLLVDVFLEQGESRQAYLTRRHAMMRQQWSGLTGPELDVITQHECESDFPDSVGDYQCWAEEAGFAAATLSLARDGGMHSWMTFFA